MNTTLASAIPSRNKQVFTAPIVSWFLSEADRLPVFLFWSCWHRYV